ncbi:MAG: hypothetical protein P4L53_14295 [Candidatus Obscuribacterales bacterium]|nr:hypothetical protein [Candidatus Obscuribacterales bacterium]
MERIIAALAASCEALSNFDYALLNLSDVEELKLQFQAVSGETADDIANDQWHRDLIELSARKILELADSMQTKAQFQRLNEQSITRIVKESIERKTIDDSRINLKGNSRQKVVK